FFMKLSAQLHLLIVVTSLCIACGKESGGGTQLEESKQECYTEDSLGNRIPVDCNTGRAIDRNPNGNNDATPADPGSTPSWRQICLDYSSQIGRLSEQQAAICRNA